eukprot:GHVU01213764.1.p1 GENE.GHVU01213764.1~~GHVU01213764.1.p1  ORF type:complete len:347 (+),score=24.23 GHVU01213764.1:94-1134(+)
MDLKRKANEGALVPSKKSRSDVAIYGATSGELLEGAPARTTNLEAPIMLLTGHDGDIFTAKFSPDGQIMVSSGYDRQILLWTVYGECENFHTMSGHTGAVIECKFNTDGSNLVTCSTDKTVAIWDMEVGMRKKRLRGHQSFVNSCDCTRRGPELICSGSDDGTIRLWDYRKKTPIQTFQNTYQVTAVSFSDTAEQIISGGIDNDLKVWDLRKNDILYRMRGHTDTPTGMELSPDGSYLLTTAMDNTVRIWDVRPFAPQERCVKIMHGNQHTFEKNMLHVAWSPDGSKVAAGSGDRFVYIWDTTSRRILYRLPGHQGSVNEIDFHPVESIILSCSSDKKIFLGEIDV